MSGGGLCPASPLPINALSVNSANNILVAVGALPPIVPAYYTGIILTECRNQIAVECALHVFRDQFSNQL